MKKIKKLNLCIAKNCFVRCVGCYNKFCKKESVSYDDLCNFLEYAKNNGLEKITLSGGDPLTREDIIDILKKAEDLELKVNLDTVGLSIIGDSHIYRTSKCVSKFEGLKYLKKLNSVGIPLDGSCEEMVSKFRKYNGNLFNEIIKILEYFDKNNIKICVNTVVHKMNKDDMLNIYNILIKHKCVVKWQVFQFMPLGILGLKNKELFYIDNNTFGNVKKKINKYNDNKLNIEFKSIKDRACNYMLIDSEGNGYKVDKNNNVEIFGNIKNNESWDNILNNI